MDESKKSVMISLVIETKEASLQQITQVLRVEPVPGASHSLGQLRNDRGARWEETKWVIDAAYNEHDGASMAIISLFQEIHADSIMLATRKFPSLKVYVDVGIISSFAATVLSINTQAIDLLSNAGAELEVRFYQSTP